MQKYSREMMERVKNILNHITCSKQVNLFLQMVGCLLIFGAVMINIGKLNVLMAAPDEFGYWTAGSFFLGYDWSSAAGLNPYYQFGYGLVLAVIMFFFDGIYLYKVAVIVNAVFLCMIFLLMKKICDRIYKGSGMLNTIISLMVCFYAANIAYVQTSTCEILLQFLYIMFLLFVTKAIEREFSFLYTAVCFVPLILMYGTHLRSISIVVVSGLILLVQIAIKYKRKVVWIAAFIILGLFFVSILKKALTNELYAESVLLSVNDYSGQVSKLQKLMSLSAIKALFVEMLGQLWYLGSASLLLVYIAIWHGMKSLKEFICGNRSKEVIYECFILLNFAAAYAVSVIYLSGATRIDSLIYGRYVEYTVVPLLVSAVYVLIMGKTTLKEIWGILIFYLILSLYINNVYLNNVYESIVYTTIIGIFKLVYNNLDNFVIPGCLCVTLISVIGLIIFRKNKISLMVITLPIFACVWWINGNSFIQLCIKTKGGQDDIKVTKIYDMIEASGEEIPIYYVYSYEDTLSIKNRIFLLQVLLEDTSIRCMVYDDFEDISDDNYYIVVNSSSKSAPTINENYVKITDGYPLTLYKTYSE